MEVEDMKRKLKELGRDEAGQTFILVLILLLLGGLMIAPLLGFMGTGLKSGQAYEKRMAELYAADAGVTDALWYITTNSDDLPQNIGDEESYSLADDEPNSKQVEYTIEYVEELIYKVTSTATTTDIGSSTTIESYIVAEDYGFLLDSAITTSEDGEVQIGNNSEVKGNIACPEDALDLDENAIWDDDEYAQKDPPSEEEWPKAEQLIWFYEQDVDISNPYPDETIDLDGVSTSIGPEYVEGEFSIYNSDNTKATLTLTGTLYITGITELAGSHEWTLDLNGNTIFVENDVTGGGASGTALWLGGKCTITGSGCIIAVGDMNFQPKISSEEGDFMLVMSVEGQVWFKPGGSYYGAVVGDTRVDMQPDCYLEWVPPPTGEDAVNFPWEGYEGDKRLTEIRTWEIDLH